MMSPRKKAGQSPVTPDIFVLCFQQLKLMHLLTYEQKIAHRVEKRCSHQASRPRFTSKWK
jgi:hypothetical protein